MAKAKTPKPAEKKTAKKTPAKSPSKYNSFKLQKRIRHPKGRITGAPRLFRDSLDIILTQWKLFGGITLVYLVLTFTLAKGFDGGLNVPELKDGLEGIFTGTTAGLSTGLTLFGLMVGSASGTASEGGAVYRSLTVIMVSLAVIWSLRQVMASKKATVRDAFYKGMHPLVPFLLVLLVMGMQLLPFFLGGLMYTAASTAGVAATVLEQVLWALLLFLFTLLSLYMVSSSMIAMYIVTLPDMRPMAALRSARELVRHRRWMVLRKLLFLPFIYIVAGALITVPVVLFVPVIAQWVFLLMLMFGLVLGHAFVYSLYRELL